MSIVFTRIVLLFTYDVVLVSLYNVVDRVDEITPEPLTPRKIPRRFKGRA
jgi:hypothetical protein